MITRLADLEGRLTLTVVEAGELIGLGRDASYEAAHRGDLPTVTLKGRRLLVPTVRLLVEVLGMPEVLAAHAVGLAHEDFRTLIEGGQPGRSGKEPEASPAPGSRKSQTATKKSGGPHGLTAVPT